MLSSRSNVLLVLGLPQCGTARVKHVLERCGAHAGDLNSLAEGQRGLLSRVGNGWDSPLELPDRYLRSDYAKQFLASLKEALTTHVANECAIACVHGMERALPLWQAALDRQSGLVQHLLVVRHPLSVVEQFRLSEGWDRDRSLLVWLQSTLAMERHSRNYSRVIVNGEQLAWDLDGTLNLIENTLQLTLPERHHKTLIELESENDKQDITISHKNLSKIPNSSAGSLLMTMALQLHDWLLAEHDKSERQRHLPETIRQQLNIAESLMGRTVNDLYLQNITLKNKMQALGSRRSVRFSNWLRRRPLEAA